jgi:hypothetical protein
LIESLIKPISISQVKENDEGQHLDVNEEEKLSLSKTNKDNQLPKLKNRLKNDGE